MSHRIAAIFVALIVVAACDPLTEPPQPASKLAEARDRDVPVIASTAASTSTDFAGCLLGCDDAKVRPADRAACRMNCERPSAAAELGLAPAVDDADPVEFAVGCIDRCYSEGVALEPCLGACNRRVAAVAAAPSPAVLDALAVCLAPCHTGKHVNDTNRATCSLNCAQMARVAGPASPVGAAGATL